jgi:hypothetical protein
VPLFDQEKSGTPIETRQGASAAGATFGDLFRGAPFETRGKFGQTIRGNQPANLEDVFGRLQDIIGRLGSSAVSDTLGFDPHQLNTFGAFEDLLAGGSTLDAALRPFEERETARQVGGLNESLGALGGRFSRNARDAEIELRGELGNQFARRRAEDFREGQGIQLQGLSTLLNSMLGAQSTSGSQTLALLDAITRYLSPGDSFIQQGLFPSLIEAGGKIGSAAAA